MPVVALDRSSERLISCGYCLFILFGWLCSLSDRRNGQKEKAPIEQGKKNNNAIFGTFSLANLDLIKILNVGSHSQMYPNRCFLGRESCSSRFKEKIKK